MATTPALSASWKLLVSSARLQRSSQTLAVVGSQAIIFGGELLPREPVDNQIDLVHLASEDKPAEILAAPSTAPSPRVGSASTALNGRVYLFSGRGGVSMEPVEDNGAVWGYTPSDAGWTLVTPADPSRPYPPARSYHATTNDGQDTIFVHAGCPLKGRLADLWAFNTATRTWTELSEAPAPPRGGTSIAFCSGNLYRMNGFDGTSEQGGSLDVYSLSSNSWSSITYKPDGVNGPEPRSVSALVAVTIGEKQALVTLFGEHDPSALGHAGAGKMLDNVWAFHLDSKQWTKVLTTGASPDPRGWFDADTFTDEIGTSSVIVHGGLAEDNSRLGDVWRLTFT